MNRELRPNDCQKRIYEGRGVNHQCAKKPVVTRDGKLYCKIHDPEYIKGKDAKRRAKWDKKSSERHQRWDLDEARKKATKGLTLQELRRVTPDLIRRALGGNQ